ncbi:hypothetical protein ACIBCN_37305 [Nocardia sp. NPDC051052]|uniref:hypothetical protein n=1 Tax=Nocardia sp. NPDC051052 TaxID=3364322 RepID=UPI00379919FD
MGRIRAGEFVVAQDWQIYFLAMITATIGVNLVWALAAPFVVPVEAYLIAGMVGAPGPLFVAYLLVAVSSSLTTTAFHQRSMRRFEASLRRDDSEGSQICIVRAALI